VQWATPSRILVFVPSMILEAVRGQIPFSACKLPVRTTKLELVGYPGNIQRPKPKQFVARAQRGAAQALTRTKGHLG
jgi:hypothetical protein